MTDTNKETLSALIDNEESEIELHRLSREFNKDDSLRRSWAAYQQIRAVARGDSLNRSLAPADHEALQQRISEAIAQEESYGLTPTASVTVVSKKRVLTTGLAIAASLVVAAAIWLAPPATEQFASDTEQHENHQELVELDEEKQRHLKKYLVQHQQMLQLNQRARLVSYDQYDGSQSR